MVKAHQLKSGQWAKEQAFRRHAAVIFGSLCVVAIVSFLAGCLIGIKYEDARRQPLLITAGGVVLGIGSAAITYALLRAPIDWIFQNLGKKRVNYLRGAQGEAFVSWLLRDLSDRWHLYDNFLISEKQDIDHVLVGPRGVFAISTKSRRGCAESVEDALVLNGERPDWISKVRGQASKLQAQLELNTGVPKLWVQPVLALPFTYIKATRSPLVINGVWVISEDDIPAVFESAERRPVAINQLADGMAAIAAQRAQRQSRRDSAVSAGVGSS